MFKGYTNKFNRGEVSADVLTRDDVARIKDCAELMQNFMPLRLGPMAYRPGTRQIGPVKAQIYHRLLPFIASADDMAILEISQTNAASKETLRVWVDDEIVVRTATSTTITNSEFTTDLAGWTDASTGTGSTAWATGGGAEILGNGAGDWGILYQTLTFTPGEEVPIRITVEDAPVFFALGSLGANSANLGGGFLRPGIHSIVLTTGVASVTLTFLNDKLYPTTVRSAVIEAPGVMEITMEMFPMTGATPVIPSLQYKQSASVMFVTSNGYTLAGRTTAPYVRIERRGSKSWSVVPVQLNDGPFAAVNTTFVVLTPAATTGVTTLTSNINFFVTGGSEGRLYKLDHAGTEGICRVLSVTSLTVAQVQVLQPFGATTGTDTWYEGRFAPNLPAPTAITISEGRLWLGGADRIYGSVSDAYDSFDETLVGNSAAIQRSLGFGPVQQVSWLNEGDVLTAGLAIGEAAIRSSALSEVLSPTNVNIKGAGTNGCAEVGPATVDSVTYFVQRTTKKILAMSGGSSTLAFTIEDTTVLHPDICDAGIVRIAVTRQPETRIFAVLNTGEVRVYLVDRVEQVTAWSRIVLAKDADILDVLVLPQGSEDEVYFLVNRYLTPPVFGGSILPESEGGPVGTLVGLESRLLVPTYGSVMGATTFGDRLLIHMGEGSISEYLGGVNNPRLTGIFKASGTGFTSYVSMQYNDDGSKFILAPSHSPYSMIETRFLPVNYDLRSTKDYLLDGTTPYNSGEGHIPPGGQYLYRINGVAAFVAWPLSTAWDPTTFGATQYSPSPLNTYIDGIRYRANYVFMNTARTQMKTVSNNKVPGDEYFPMFNVSFSTAGDWTTYSVDTMVKFYTGYNEVVATQLVGDNYLMLASVTGGAQTRNVLEVNRLTASVINEYSPTQVGRSATGMAFSSDGRFMYLTGVADGAKGIVRATLTSPFAIENATWGALVVVGSSVRAIAFNDTGTRMYVVYINSSWKLEQFDLSIAWDIESVRTFAGSAAWGTGSYYDLQFRPDGLGVYCVDSASRVVRRFPLSTAWDVTTLGASVSGPDISAQSNQPRSLCFTLGGTRMFIATNDGYGMNEYSLSTAWDTTTSTFLGANKGIIVGAGHETASRHGVRFSTDGTKAFILAVRDPVAYACEVFQYATINSPDIASLAAVTPTWEIYSATELFTKVQAHDETLGAGMFVKPDGLKLYYFSVDSGGVDQYTMSAALDLSTAGSPAATAYGTITGQIYFDPDGNYLIAPVNAPSAGVGRFALTAPWVLAGSTQDSFKSIAGADVAFTMSPNGLHAFYFDSSDSTIRHLTMSPAWDVSAATQTETFDPANVGFLPTPALTALWLHPEGTYLYVVDPTVGVLQYTMLSPFTLTGMVITSTSNPAFADPYAFCIDPSGENVFTVDSTLQQFGLLMDIALVPNGTVATGITLEKMAKFSDSKGGPTSEHYDSHTFYDSANPGTTLSGLENLNFEEAYLWSGGKEYGPFAVEGGSISTGTEYPYPTVGLRHDAAYVSNRLADYIDANVFSEFKRVTQAGLVLSNAVLSAVKLGPDATRMRGFPQIDYEFLDPDIAQSYDNRVWEFDGEFSTDSRIRIEATGPCLVKALTYYVDQPFDTPSQE